MDGRRIAAKDQGRRPWPPAPPGAAASSHYDRDRLVSAPQSFLRCIGRADVAHGTRKICRALWQAANRPRQNACFTGGEGARWLARFAGIADPAASLRVAASLRPDSSWNCSKFIVTPAAEGVKRSRPARRPATEPSRAQPASGAARFAPSPPSAPHGFEKRQQEV